MRKTFVATAAVGALSSVYGMEIDTGNPEVQLRWDNQIRYSLAYRLERPSQVLSGNISGADTTSLNGNDGDLNFARRARPISNRVDLYSEADLQYRNYGVRLSGAAWYDAAYFGGNSNTSQASVNTTSVPAGTFAEETKNLQGKKAELLDAFFFGKSEIGSFPVSFRVGKHALVWGETLFFGNNGIAGGMAPVDVVKILSSPNASFKESTLPVGQVSGQIQLLPNVSLAAYAQYEWRSTRLPAAGSYFSANDLFPQGGENLLSQVTVPTPGGPINVIAKTPRGADVDPGHTGQGGVSLRFKLPGSDTDYGLYAIRYNAKTPMLHVNLGIVNGSPRATSYDMIYPKGINAFGASFANTFDALSLSAEASIRTNAPLTKATIAVAPGQVADGGDNALYATGRTAHVNLVAIYTVPSNFLARESSLAAEVAWNRLLSVTKNPAQVDPNTTRDAIGFRVLYTPTYRQVIDGVDLSVPVGIGYSPKGKSSAGVPFTSQGGDLSVGVAAAYRENVTLGASYTHYIGSSGPTLDANGNITFRQGLGDRDYVSVYARYAF